MAPVQHRHQLARCGSCGDAYWPDEICPTCKRCVWCCGCEDDFDADELGLDPEEEYDA